MACLAMHLAICKQYLLKHKTENETEFINGSLAPDLSKDKIASHFGVNKKPTSVREMMEYKVDIVDVAKNKKLDSSFSRAEFLHLICDDIFYRYVYSEELEKWSPEEIKQAMYDDFDYVTYYILNKYDIKLPENLNSLANNKQGKSRFFSAEAIDLFVDVISSVDLTQAKQQILTNLPKFREDLISKLNLTKKQIKTK